MYRPDTSDEVQKKYDDVIRALSPSERFLRGLSLTAFARRMCLEGLKARYPEASEAELRIKFFDTLYGHLYSEEEREKIHSHLT